MSPENGINIIFCSARGVWNSGSLTYKARTPSLNYAPGPKHFILIRVLLHAMWYHALRKKKYPMRWFFIKFSYMVLHGEFSD
jgi:hypothetical protein